MLVQTVDVELLDGTRLRLRFDDGAEASVDIADVIRFEEVFSALRRPEVFDQVRVDAAWGTVTWPGGLDLAPGPLHDLIAGDRSVSGQRSATV
ncbi:MAG: DUF2442 domain-containing protein [Myxococcales bacterium]|nr:DUF2442 domain-containing protein [Myxococcales bacterium]MCB9540359.1 DUF2442 domain-containing protein [Myxococcales bacterium]